MPTPKAAPFPGSHDFIAFLRVIDEVGRGEGDYRKRLEDWVNRVAVTQAEFVQTVEKGNAAAEESQARAERDMEAREEALERATEAYHENAATLEAEAEKATSDAHKALESERIAMVGGFAADKAKLNQRAEQVAQSESKALETMAAAAVVMEDARKILAQAEAKQAEYAKMMDRVREASA